MNNINTNIIHDVMSAFDRGVSADVLIELFPEHANVIREIEETRSFLFETAETISLPRTHESLRFEDEGFIKSPYINRSLFFTMSYKFVLPVLVLGIMTAGGALFLGGGSTEVAVDQDETSAMQNTDVAKEEAIPSEAALEEVKNEISADANVDDILSDLTNDVASEQSVYADDGVTADMFAPTELSSFESDTYGF